MPMKKPSTAASTRTARTMVVGYEGGPAEMVAVPVSATAW